MMSSKYPNLYATLETLGVQGTDEIKGEKSLSSLYKLYGALDMKVYAPLAGSNLQQAEDKLYSLFQEPLNG